MPDRIADRVSPVWHALPLKQVLGHFALDRQRGLTAAAGDAVAVDARLVDAVQSQEGEAALTDESVPVAKSQRSSWP